MALGGDVGDARAGVLAHNECGWSRETTHKTQRAAASRSVRSRLAARGDPQSLFTVIVTCEPYRLVTLVRCRQLVATHVCTLLACGSSRDSQTLWSHKVGCCREAQHWLSSERAAIWGGMPRRMCRVGDGTQRGSMRAVGSERPPAGGLSLPTALMLPRCVPSPTRHMRRGMPPQMAARSEDNQCCASRQQPTLWDHKVCESREDPQARSVQTCVATS